MQIVDVHGLPANAPGIAYCGRGFAGWNASPLGNPFVVGKHGRPGECVKRYRRWLFDQIRAEGKVLEALETLTESSVLGCWCINLADAVQETELVCHCQIVARAWQWLNKEKIWTSVKKC